MADLLRLGKPNNSLLNTEEDDSDGLFLDNETAYRRDVLNERPTFEQPRVALAQPELQQIASAPIGGGMFSYLGAAPAKPAAEKTEAPPVGGSMFSYLSAPPPAIEPEKPKSNKSDAGRGFAAAIDQTPALLKGAVGFAGAAGEKAFGEGGMFSGLKKYGLEGYQKGMAEISEKAKDTDELTAAWDKAKQGDLGALVDWAQYGIGYLGGNVVETVGTSVLGGMIGSVVGTPGVGTVAGAATGAVGKEAVKGVARNLIESMVAKEAAKIAERKGLEVGSEAVVKEATKSVAKNIGATTALAGSSILKETGGIYGEAVEEAGTDNLSAGDLARVFGAGVVAGLSEFAVDKLGLDVAAGKIKIPGGGRVGRAVVGGAVGAGIEGGQELLQTAIERYGAAKELTGEDAMKDYINSFGLGALGGGTVGGLTGALRSGKTDPDRVRKILDDAEKELSSGDGRQEVFSAMMQDEKMRPILEANGIESGEDPRFQSVITKVIATQKLLADLETPSSEERSQRTKERGEDVRAAFGETASTAVGVATGATEPVIRRESVTPDVETKQLVPVDANKGPEPVVLPEGKTTPAGTVALAPEDIVSRQQGYEVQPAFAVGGQTIGNRFTTRQQAETFLFGPVNKETGKREGGYASSVADMEFQIRQGQRSKEAGGGNFYFVEGREKTQQAAAAPAPAAPSAPAPAPAAPVVNAGAVSTTATQTTQEAANATQAGQVQQGDQQQREGAGGRLEEGRNDRQQPPQDQAAGGQAGGGNRAQQGGKKQAAPVDQGKKDEQPNPAVQAALEKGRLALGAKQWGQYAPDGVKWADLSPESQKRWADAVQEGKPNMALAEEISPKKEAAPKKTVEQQLKDKQKAKKDQPKQEPKRDKAKVRSEAIELWEDNDDGVAPHVPFAQLDKERQQEWIDAYAPDEGKPYASAELHDKIVNSQKKNERAERINEKVAENKKKEADDDKVTFRVTRKVKGLTTTQVAKVYDALVKTWAKVPDVVIVQSESELPANVQEQINKADANGKVPGLFTGGKVYLIADNLSDANDVIVTTAHEVTGHFGLRRLLGDAYSKTMMDIYRGNKSVREKADAMMKKEGLSLEIAVEEVLADMAEAGVTADSRTALQQIFAAIRKWLRSVGVSFVTDSDLRQLVSNARRYVIEGDIEAGQGKAAFDTALKQGTPTFYSALEREVRGAKQKSALAKDWKAIVSKLSGVKKEEIEWTGLDEWLDLQDPKAQITREQVLAFVAANRVRVNDVILTEGKGALDDSELREMVESIGENADGMRRDDMLDIVANHFGWKRKDLGDARHKQYTLGEGTDYTELIVVDPTAKSYKLGDRIHFGDVSQGKALGWLRMINRKDKDGNDVLFLEELQSQRGQDGRDAGFAKVEVSRNSDNEWVLSAGNYAETYAASRFKSVAEAKAWARDNMQVAGVPSAPFVEDTRAWTSLLLKRAIAYAQEKGIDRLAWTTGDQQVDRYKLSKRIDQVVYVKDKRTGEVTISAMKGNKTLTEKTVPADKVGSVVGKDLAEQISQNKGVELDNEVETSGVISGLDLDVGGDGLRTYYNQTVPSVAKDLIKKYGGSTEVMEIDGQQQLGFVVPEKLQQTVAEDGLPLFRRKDYESQYDDLPEDSRKRALAKGHYSPPSIRERLESLKPDLWLRVVQGVFDPFRRVRDISEKAYMMLRLSTSTDGALEGLVHYGQVFNDGGALRLKKGTKGLIEIMQPLGGETDRFLLWIAANRADQLSKEDRERFFSSEDIAALKRLNVGTMKNGKSRVSVYAETLREMNELNRSVLDLARNAGLIDDAAYKRFSQDIWYVPFYRVMEDDGSLSAAQTSSGSVGQYLSKKLKGSDRQLNDLMQNVLMNWSHILSASMKNNAANETLTAAQQMGGIVTKLDRQEKGAVKTMVKGKEAYWRIEDEFLLNSLDTVSNYGGSDLFVRVAGPFKTTLTRFISLSPTFKINNLVRDSVQSIGLTELEKNPFANVIEGWRAFKDDRADALIGGGIFTLGNAYDGDRTANVKRLIKAGVPSETILSTPEKVQAFLKKGMDKYDEISDAAENANRLALYNQLRSKGASHLEAAYAARDLQDFSLQGSWPIIRYAAAVLPYFNARMQGMYKLGRDGIAPSLATMMGTANDSERQKAAKFGTVLAGVVGVSLALYLMHKDDEDFKKREDWDRDGFWWFKVGDVAFRIPKPFEMGAIATVVERFTEQIVDSDVEGKVFGKRLLAVLSDNLAINIIPQIARPAYDVSRNKDGFTDRPIESMGMERLSPENRINAGTSAAGVAMGTINAMFADFAETVTGGAVTGNNLKLSPIQYDYLLRGYLGWVGTVIQTASNIAASPFREGEAPDRKIDDLLVIGNYVKSLPQNQSRYVTSFYENAKQMALVTADYNAFRAAGQAEKAAELAETKGDLIAMNRLYTRVSDRMSEISKRIKMIDDDKEMPGEQKRVEMDRLAQLRIELAKAAEETRIKAKRGE
jgi:hypothetical protein